MSILLNEKSTFCKQHGLSGKALMEKVLVEVPKLLLGEVETYNISENKTFRYEHLQHKTNIQKFDLHNISFNYICKSIIRKLYAFMNVNMKYFKCFSSLTQ